MNDIPMTVYIISTVLLWNDFSSAELVIEKEPQIFRELKESIRSFGEVFCTANRELDYGLECRWIVCINSAWPELDLLNRGFQIRSPSGEIVEGPDCLFFVDQSSLTLIRNTVLLDLFLYDDGVSFTSLDQGIDRRLKSWACSELSQENISPKIRCYVFNQFRNATLKVPPKDWDWVHLKQELHSITNSYLAELRLQSSRWFVVESLYDIEISNLSIFFNTSEHLVEALVDKVGEARQWLLLASPVIEARSLPNAELTSVRPLERYELFYTRRGMVWLNDEELIWLGGLPADFFNDSHGNVVEDLKDQLRRHVVEAVTDCVLERNVSNQLPIDIVEQSVHDVLDSQDLLQLWIRDIQSLSKKVMATFSS